MKGNPPVPGARYAALLDLLRTAEALWEASRVFFVQWDLSPSQFNVLNLLTQRPDGCTQTELSRQLIMHRSNVTGLVDRLEARGLVQRQDDPGDRRAFNVRLTRSGEKLIRQILPEFYQSAESVWGAMPADRVRQLVSELAAVSANAERIAAGADTRRKKKIVGNERGAKIGG